MSITGFITQRCAYPSACHNSRVSPESIFMSKTCGNVCSTIGGNVPSAVKKWTFIVHHLTEKTRLRIHVAMYSRFDVSLARARNSPKIRAYTGHHRATAGIRLFLKGINKTDAIQLYIRFIGDALFADVNPELIFETHRDEFIDMERAAKAGGPVLAISALAALDIRIQGIKTELPENTPPIIDVPSRGAEYVEAIEFDRRGS